MQIRKILKWRGERTEDIFGTVFEVDLGIERHDGRSEKYLSGGVKGRGNSD